MMPIDDKIQVLELKAQQIIQRMMPNGYEIDVDAIVELDLGDGAKYTQQGVIDMFFETGTNQVDGLQKTTPTKKVFNQKK